jgi:hypothetical protein
VRSNHPVAVAFHRAFAASAAAAVVDVDAVVEGVVGLLLQQHLPAELVEAAAVALNRLDFPFEVESPGWNPPRLVRAILSDS